MLHLYTSGRAPNTHLKAKWILLRLYEVLLKEYIYFWCLWNCSLKHVKLHSSLQYLVIISTPEY